MGHTHKRAQTATLGRRTYDAENSSRPGAPDTIVLIHGLWVTPRSWEHWIEHYEGRGYRVLAPAYPGLEVEVEALNEDPSPIEALTIPAVVEHLEGIVGELEKPPIIMGHSAGGLFTQILLDHGYGAAGVAIDSAPAEGVRVTPVSQIRVSLPDPEEPRQPPQGRRVHQRAVPLRLRQHPKPGGVRRGLRALPHPRAGQLRVGRAPRQLHARPPGHLRELQERRSGALLFIAGGEDNLMPPAVNQSNAKHYRHTKTVTDYKEFPGRSHYTVGQDGWEEVADYALEWAEEHATTRPASLSTRPSTRRGWQRTAETPTSSGSPPWSCSSTWSSSSPSPR